MLPAMATYKKVHQRRVPYTELTISSSREICTQDTFGSELRSPRGGRSSAPLLADRSTGTAPRGWSDYGTSTRRIHSGPRYPRYWRRSTNAVSRDASHAVRSANHIPLQYPAQRQMLNYHALPEDLRLMKIPKPLRLSCRTALRIVRLTSYILKSPELTLFQVATPVAIEYSCEECSWNGPRLTSWIRMIDRK
jgi:hypothetical protein